MKRCFVLSMVFLGWLGGILDAHAAVAPGFISGVTATASTEYSGRGAVNTVNNSGCVEAMVGLKSASHSVATSDEWLNSGANVANDWIEFDLGASHPLDQMWIWNCNQSGYGVRSLKNVYIKYKLNAGDAWTTLGGAGYQFTLAQAGGTAASGANNQVGGAPIAFGGLNIRYVRIEPAGGPGIGNYATDNYAGLGEVRFYEAATQPTVQPAVVNFGLLETGKVRQTNLVVGASGGSSNVTINSADFVAPANISFVTTPTLPKVIPAGQATTLTLTFQPTAIGLYQTTLTLNLTSNAVPMTVLVPISGRGIQYTPYFITNVIATGSSNYTTIRSVARLTDNSGIQTEPLVGSKTAQHDGDYNNTMWLSAGTGPINQEWVEFDLGRVVFLDEMWLWNQNGGGTQNLRGFKDTNIFYKVNAGDTWTKLGTGTYTFKQGTGTVSGPSNLTNGLPVTFANARARYVRLECVTNYGDTQYVGLSEVRFYEAPPVAKASASQTSLVFPTINLYKGDPPATLTLDINSIGTGPLKISNVVLTGAPAYSLVSPPALPVTLDYGQKLTLTAKFAPTVEQLNQTASLVITTDDTTQPTITIPLSGDSVPVELSTFKTE